MAQSDYRRVERAIRFIDDHFIEQPNLDEVAAHVGLSPHHFQRLFQRWAGVSPKRFLQFTTAVHARRLLRNDRSTLDATLDLGLSSTSRLHDLMVTIDAVTPGEHGSRGEGLVIRYGIHESPFGECLLATTDRGVCALHFLDGASSSAAVSELAAEWPAATLREHTVDTATVLAQIFSTDSSVGVEPLPVLVKGTNFQVRVWLALLRLSPGSATTYGRLAGSIDEPGAARAVGTAIGRNAIAFLIPCHRVLRSCGGLGGYRWGPERKRALLAWESARLCRGS